MNAFKIQKGSVVSPKGFRASGIRCGIKSAGRDLAIIASDGPAVSAALFTTNQVPAAPIIVSRLRAGNGAARAIVINSGNANACTGDQGIVDAEEMIEVTARGLDLESNQVLVASTGLIGESLPMNTIRAGIAKACAALSREGGQHAARAIMTTDTKPKHFSIDFELDGMPCCIGAVAKGSGMINPNLATMICVFTTDVQIKPELLQDALRNCIKDTLNALTIDAEMSTNDAVFIFANGQSGTSQVTSKSTSYSTFTTALRKISTAITHALALDAEGATRMVTVKVEGAKNNKEAKKAAEAIANSMLVKTAIYGCDPNWGRVVAAVGGSGVVLDPTALAIRFANIMVAKNGCAVPFDKEAMKKKLRKDKIEIQVMLNAGDHSASVFTCDLTHDYITINAEYHT